MDNQVVTGQPGAGDMKLTTVVPDTEPLDVEYGLSPHQAAFFKAQTGIDNDDDLRAHILAVQERAYKIFPYPCIRSFMFLDLGISNLPEYKDIIQLGQDRPDEILLDIACCFGTDSRKAAADGFPLKNIVISDLHKEFFEMGHTLFNTTPASFPISFVHGDAFDPEVLEVVPPSEKPPPAESSDLAMLTSLNRLAGRCSVIFASNFFHLFSEDNQLHLAKALAGLLSPHSGSMICGEHAGYSEKGIQQVEVSGRLCEVFNHSPESWAAVWDGEVFGKGKVRVDATLKPVKRGTGLAYQGMQWSVVRL